MITDLIQALYDPAIRAGMTSKEFWDSSIAEIEVRIEAYGQEKEAKLKERINQIFLLAQLFAERHPPIPFVKYPSNSRYTMPWDVCPELFQEEKGLSEALQKNEELERYKASRRAYYALHNMKMRRGGGGNSE